MVPWVLIDRARTPNGGELRLMRRGEEFSIMLDTVELMNSRKSGSEEALATLSCRKLRDSSRARILVGGLGMGFTLRAALAELGPQAQVTVAELVPAVVGWGRGPMADIFAGCLDDPRVRVHDGDVGALIRSRRAAYDAVLLDVDNGPEGLTRTSNNRLYDEAGLGAARAALRRGGILGVWSAERDPSFTARLRRMGFDVEEVSARANGRRGGARHTIWVATQG